MQEKKNSSVKLPELNWIRGVAALLIVLYHYTTRYQEVLGHNEGWNVSFFYGCGAVNIFFILSGFLTAMTFKEDSCFVDYLKKKAVRLYPAYWACLILTSIAMFFFWRERFVGIPSLIVNLTMLQGFLGVTPVDGAYWTLMYELQFYIYIAVLLLIRKGKWLRTLALVGTLLSLLVFLLAPILSTNIVFKLVRFALLGDYGISFFGGVLVYAIKKNSKDIFAYVGIILCVILSYFEHSRVYFWFYIIMTVILLAVCFVHVEKNSRYISVVTWLDRNVLFAFSFVAKVSFPLYLIHQNIGMAILLNMEKLGWTSEWVIMIPFVITVFMSWFIWRLVEYPVEKLLHIKSKCI